MIYTSLLIILLLFMLVDYGTRSSSYALTTDKYSLVKEGKKTYKRHFVVTVSETLLFFWFLYAIAIMGLRGNFSADYNSYTTWFYRMNNMSDAMFWEYFGFHNIFSRYMETGYAVLNRLIGLFTNDPIWVFVISAIIICFPVYKLSKKSKMPWLAILLWISIGSYLEGFSTMRGAMAASILIFSVKYLQERKLVKYIIVVLIATTFHSIAILMLFAYFLPLVKPSKKSIFILILVAVIVSASGEILTTRFNSIFHIASDDSGALSLLYRYSSTGASLVVPLLIEIFALYMFFDEVRKGSINSEDPYIRMMFNGNLIWILFKLLTIYTGYATRFAMLFFYYPCILIPFLVKRRRKKFMYILIVVLATSWYLVNSLVRYPTYYFAF